jgi:hypothetical protein
MRKVSYINKQWNKFLIKGIARTKDVFEQNKKISVLKMIFWRVIRNKVKKQARPVLRQTFGRS